MDDQGIRVTRLGPTDGLCKMRPGFVKRIPSAGPLLGYYVSCPACGFKHVFTEGVQEQETGITLHRAVECVSPLCKRVFEVRDDVMYFKGTTTT